MVGEVLSGGQSQFRPRSRFAHLSFIHSFMVTSMPSWVLSVNGALANVSLNIDIRVASFRILGLGDSGALPQAENLSISLRTPVSSLYQ